MVYSGGRYTIIYAFINAGQVQYSSINLIGRACQTELKDHTCGNILLMDVIISVIDGSIRIALFTLLVVAVSMSRVLRDDSDPWVSHQTVAAARLQLACGPRGGPQLLQLFFNVKIIILRPKQYTII